MQRMEIHSDLTDICVVSEVDYREMNDRDMREFVALRQGERIFQKAEQIGQLEPQVQLQPSNIVNS